MTAAFAAEVIKLRKRPSTWVLSGILISVILLLGYVATYFIQLQLLGNPDTARDGETVRAMLLLQNVTLAVLGIVASLGGPIALILGAMTAGSEYGWGTLKTILTQRPGRLSVLAGKAGGLAALLAGLVVISFGAASVSAGVATQLVDAPLHLPGAWELVRGLAAGWLILAAWTAIGFALAILVRGTALAVGLGLVYGLVVENLIAGLSGVVDLFDIVRKGLPGPNASALAAAFDKAAVSPQAAVGPGHAALVLGAYVVGAVALASVVLWRRDVT
ncbi:MAG: ABC transporter permease [Chloroflexota bacterium]|nr:ABC transporter permease [Chloroflexota bacterium]